MNYIASGPFRNGHFNTIYPHFFRKNIVVPFRRERFTLSDGDFVDLDWIKNSSRHVVLLLHGLEGSSDSHYIKGLSRALMRENLDIAVLNQRGCSGEPNLKFASYHSGKTDDLHEVVNDLASKYNDISIVGFSMGGNICLKYCGEQGDQLNPKIGRLVGVSVPCNLSESANYLKRWDNHFYMKRFMRMLNAKLHIKVEQFPEEGITHEMVDRCRDFKSFDNLYTAPANGYKNAEHYWLENSSKGFVPMIQCKTLVLNSLDDPFFGPKSQPIEESSGNPNVELVLTTSGGHVGFSNWKLTGNLWHEGRIMNFLND